MKAMNCITKERSGRKGFRSLLVKMAGLVAMTLPAFIALGADSVTQDAVPAGMALVPASVYKPMFRGPDDPKEVAVASFHLDALPVTNAEYLEFVTANPRWRRSAVKRIFADENYLKSWTGDLSFSSDEAARQPVTYVSWFAAKAFAAWKGKRLPTTAEWEVAAAASPTQADGSSDKVFKDEILRWHTTPTPEVMPLVGSGPTNYFGIQDMHGLVWEWVADFNTAMVTGDSRGDTGLERQLFCGAGSASSTNRDDYAVYIRFGFRSSLKANYTVHNLGFRCARDL